VGVPIVIWLAGCFVIGLVAGLIAGRWWALVLAVLVPVAFIPAGDDSDGAPEWQTALVLLAPFALVGIAVGVFVRRAHERRRSRFPIVPAPDPYRDGSPRT
jgi:uncharacterized membrane protein YhaH (DUF805 family)